MADRFVPPRSPRSYCPAGAGGADDDRASSDTGNRCMNKGKQKMTSTGNVSRAFRWVLAVIAAVGFAGTLWAGIMAVPAKSDAPRGSECCWPNAANFGYFRSSWRQWPGEDRPDQRFPSALGREVLPTPEGREELPAPPAEKSPQRGLLPPGLPEPGESIVPPGGTTQDRPLMIPGGLEEPADSLRRPLLPAAPGVVPGLTPGTPPGQPDSVIPPPPAPERRPTVPPAEGGSDRQSTAPKLEMGNQQSSAQKVGRSLPERLPELVPIEPGIDRRAGLPRLEAPVSDSPSSDLKTPASGATSRISTGSGRSSASRTLPGDAHMQQRASSPTEGQPSSGSSPPARTAPLRDPLRPADGAIDSPKAQWSRVLEPGRGHELPRRPFGQFTQTPTYSLPSDKVIPLPPVEPVQTGTGSQSAHLASHVAPVERPVPGVIQQPVFNQPVGQRPIVAQAGWITDKPGASDNGARPGAGGPLALEGYCPVELSKHERWTKGSAQWAVSYRGATYHCAGPVQRECFLADPERYVPVSQGCDVVALLDEDRNVSGVVDHCVVYEGRLYMFSSAAAVEKFRSNPRRYAVP